MDDLELLEQLAVSLGREFGPSATQAVRRVAERYERLRTAAAEAVEAFHEYDQTGPQPELRGPYVKLSFAMGLLKGVEVRTRQDAAANDSDAS